jgi:hypothetical protein
MPRRSKIGLAYGAWLKKWRKAGKQAWPEVIKIVVVHWTDAAYSEEDTGTIEAIKIGLLLEANEKEIALAMEGFEDRTSRTKITVPAGMVNRVIDIATVSAFDED